MKQKFKQWGTETGTTYEGEVSAVVVDTPETRMKYAVAEIVDAIAKARAAGYVVDAPFNIKDLERISVSETAKVKH